MQLITDPCAPLSLILLVLESDSDTMKMEWGGGETGIGIGWGPTDSGRDITNLGIQMQP